MKNTAKLNEYVKNHSTEEDKVLQELDRATHLHVLRARMLSGHEQGMLLYLLVRMLKPQRILELGTYTGYSAISMAKGLDDGAKLISIDKNDELLPFAQEFVRKAHLEDKIELLSGDAKNLIPSLNDTFDLVFLDAHKAEYIDYYNLVFDKIPSGGFILADNVLWDSKVLEDTPDSDAQTQGIIAFNKLIKKNNRVENLILPIRDGINIIRKK
ncbi:putative O-methyltransferase YrrM [Balneicella halophila]|uniref:Putative O-methyltransferase YrrM n=1 Tax=Balneicella halophila TaxID=1537566 RepID=A0A7L4UQF0_BALHA|nr:O-methyltransferase [Balneicella halophila]PVX51742.1 putative O-methyltransferase YrrM [Balneicella halophila]